MIKKIITSSVTLMFASVVVFCQPGSGRGMSPEMRNAREAILKGIIIDKADETPLEFASVAIYKVRDSLLVDGGIANTGGLFELTKLPYGKFYLVVNFIGYEKKIVANILLLPNKPIVDVGKIELSPRTTDMEKVEIIRDRNHISYKIDRKVINVAQDIANSGGSAVDILENTPSVEVDMEGNILLRGSSNFTVLLNGKPTALTGTQALEQLPASMIENLEIITNPSAKYDPDGDVGIINVVTKQTKTKGYNGIINTSYTFNNRYKGNVMLSRKTQKFNAFLGVDIRDYFSTGTIDMLDTKQINDNTVEKTINNGDRERGHAGKSIKPGIDYYISDKSMLSASFDIGTSEHGREVVSKVDKYTLVNDTPISFIEYNSTSPSKDTATYVATNINFQQKFSSPLHKLEVGAFYKTENNHGGDRISTDPEYSPSTYEIEEGSSSSQRYNIDYSHPLPKGAKFETGGQVRHYNSKNNIDKPGTNSDYYLELDRNIFAHYFVFNQELNRFGYQIGLRTEYTGRKLNRENSSYNKTQLFPTIHSSYNLSDNIQFQASYSKRINRPRERYLNADTSYINNERLRIGNLLLRPETSDNFELGSQFTFNQGFISVEAFYRKKNDKISFYLTQVDSMNAMTFKNVGEDQSLGFETSFNYDIFKWFKINAMFSLFHYTLEKDESLDNNSLTSDKSTISSNARLNTTFMLSPMTRFQVSGFYRGPSISAQGSRGEMKGLNIALKQEFFDRKLTATISVRDVFNSMKMDIIQDTPTLYSEMHLTREPRSLTLSLSYMINNYKASRGNKPDGSNSDMDMGF
ncbi:TonB-dependent receptor [Bacteroidales bacterium]|nr:TonB-dependent receptor [Bacteroidales bacterium]